MTTSILKVDAIQHTSQTSPNIFLDANGSVTFANSFIANSYSIISSANASITLGTDSSNQWQLVNDAVTGALVISRENNDVVRESLRIANTGNVTIANNLTVQGNTSFTNFSLTGNTTLGDAAGDTLTINAGTASLPNNLSITGNLSLANNLTVSGVVSGTGFSNYLASPPAIGGSSPAAGSFTTLTTSSTVTINGGTANGVGYLNASKVLTTGSALTFDGSQLSVGTAGSTSNGLKLNSSNAGANYVLYRDGTTGLLQVYGNQTGFNGLLVSGVDGQQYLSDPSKHIWSVSNSEQMRLTSTGLGIGTNSPGAKLHVAGSILFPFGANGVFSDSTSRKPILFTSYDGGSNTDYLQVGSPAVSGGVGTDIRFNTGTFAGWGEKMRLDSSGNLGLGVTPSAAYLTLSGALQMGQISVLSQDINSFYINGNLSQPTGKFLKTGNYGLSFHIDSAAGSFKWFNTSNPGTAGGFASTNQAMTLTAAGNLGVGTTNPQAIIDASGGTLGFYRSSTAGTNFFSTFSGGSTGDTYYANVFGTGQFLLRCEYRGGGLGGITTNGSTITYGGTSDQRLKDNISDSPSALDSINAIKVRSFNWKSDGSRVDYGYIAQELVDLAPETVHVPEDSEEMLLVDYGRITPRLVKAIQELHAEIESLKQRIN
jgi:hypothetical protein